LSVRAHEFELGSGDRFPCRTSLQQNGRVPGMSMTNRAAPPRWIVPVSKASACSCWTTMNVVPSVS
jgi:hypothetical protein